MQPHIFIPGEENHLPFLLLHGTGGDEESMVSLAKMIDPAAPLLSLRGTVNENGANRYFKRNGLNQFDLVDLEKQTDLLWESIQSLAEKYALNLQDLVAVGYSNGANIAAHMLLQRQNTLKKAILFHPMSLGKHTETFSLADVQVWLSVSDNDPIITKESFLSLLAPFRARHATIDYIETNHGHQIDQKELAGAKKWLKDLGVSVDEHETF